MEIFLDAFALEVIVDQLLELVIQLGAVFEHVGTEEFAQVLVLAVDGHQQQQTRDRHEDFSVSVLNLFIEGWILFSDGLKSFGKV